MSPSAAKPAQVVASWHALPIDIIEPTPVTVDDLARVHERAWAEDVLAGRADNGFGNRSLEIAATLPFTNGSMLSAARHAIAHRTVAAAPCSGFHHAGRRAGAFCTFNGLVVAACALRAEGLADRVGIVDLDMHYGDGTDWLIREHRLDFIDHFTAGADYHSADQAPMFFERLPDRLHAMSDCNVILYQAGADPHIDDPLGGWLTTEELHRRDAMVFGEFAARQIPIAWNLAGGYQVDPDGSIPRVLEIHANTARAALSWFAPDLHRAVTT
ncbi:MAG: histone deacetylase [Myxococcota bacterium]|nr:histone deacetylase [Myxococcota bacterium]